MILMPHDDGAGRACERWKREAGRGPPDIRAGAASVFRIYDKITRDIFFHLGVAACARLGPAWCRGLVARRSCSDRSGDTSNAWTLPRRLSPWATSYLRREGMKLLVAQSRIASAVQLVRAVTEAFLPGAGEPMTIVLPTCCAQSSSDKRVDLRSRGSFVHHYPIFLPTDPVRTVPSCG